MKKILLVLICVLGSTMVWSNGQKETSALVEKDEHLEITFGYWQEELFGGEFNRENDEMIQFIEEKFDLTIEPKFVTWADFGEKYRLWAAAGELPDFFAHDLDKTTYHTWVKQGVLRSIPQDLSAYPELEKLFARPDIEYLSLDDTFYHIPRLHSMYPNVARGIVVRKDWMEKLNIDEPETFAEYKDMMDRFVKEDPDGNGVNDTIGVMVKKKNFLDTILVNFNPAYIGKFWVEENGQWIPYFMSDKMSEAVSTVGNLFQDDLLYDDFILMTETNAGTEKFAYGTAGSLLTQCDPPRMQQLKDNWDKFNPDKPFNEYVKILDNYPFPDENGDKYNMANKAYWSSDFFSGTVDDNKMDRILQIINYLNTDEGYELWYRGLEGKDYTKNGSTYTDLRPLSADGSPVSLSDIYPSSLFFGGMAYWGNDRTFFNADKINFSRYNEDVVQMTRSYASKLEDTKAVDTSYNISELGNEFLAENKFGEIIEDDIEASIMAEDIDAAWADFIEYYKELGIEKIIKDFNAKVKAEGLK